MSRKIRAVAFALSLTGGVYFAAGTAQASNMGFKLERSFDFLRKTNGTPLQNVYYFSGSLFNGLGDTCDAAFTGANKCVETGGAPAGDGTETLCDIICDGWTHTDPNTAGAFSVSLIDVASCGPVSCTASISRGLVRFALSPEAPLVDAAGSGYQVNIGPGATGDPVNRVVLVGSHDPSFAGHPVISAATCGALAPRIDLLAVPYHTMYQNVIEIACGLKGSAWIDDNGDGLPEDLADCGQPPRGIFDGIKGIGISTWINDEATNGPVSITVTNNRNSLRITGPNYALVPGEAYALNIDPAHTATNFLSPHF